ncbi:DNA-binding transcriptional regulator, LysR family [Acetitomaculum ruminis DSM 5522]|uniref:DNA-binding transcriptional regulator, LysR family n=1 Tax=Acetitomaculum ruminis DSM 5522 TaxID=1120918 RepID=A0A1I0YC65_9FIRM|nr:LysR family transcriptional regulator [Acetitomaculum ruminis]SFB10861.1 DNA-binding transcriptional regulator, LysR family [Acetitomaculum ruminis DSM 5522]
MNIKQIEFAIALADNKSFTKAAKSVYVAQSALSRQIAKLESEVGIQLFVRGTAEVKLTKEGQVMIDAFKRINKILNQSIISVRKSSDKTMQLRVGILGEFESIPELNKDFIRIKEKYPDADITVSSYSEDELYENYENKKLDLIFTDYNEVYGEDNRSIELWREGYYLLLPREHAIEKEEDIGKYDFTKEKCVLYKRKENALTSEFKDAVKKRFKITDENFIYARSMDSMIACNEMGIGFAVVPPLIRFKKNKKVKLIPLKDFPLRQMTMSAVWKKKDKNLLLAEFITNLFRQGF